MCGHASFAWQNHVCCSRVYFTKVLVQRLNPPNVRLKLAVLICVYRFCLGTFEIKWDSSTCSPKLIDHVIKILKCDFTLFFKIFPDMELKAEPVSQQFMNMGAYNSP